MPLVIFLEVVVELLGRCERALATKGYQSHGPSMYLSRPMHLSRQP
jgi:hypothetical protein